MALTWKCDICHAQRPDAVISVHKVDVGPANLPRGCVLRNVKYCNDNPPCRQGALDWKEVFQGVKLEVTADCGCGGKMIPHPWRSLILICDRSHWWNRKKHAYLLVKGWVSEERSKP